MSGLYGIWQPVSSTQTWREYREDGTFRVAGTRDSLEETPLVTGEYWYEENVLYFKEVSADPEWACGGEDIGQYEVQTLANGEIKFIKVKDGCLERASALSNATYKKVEEKVNFGQRLPLVVLIWVPFWFLSRVVFGFPIWRMNNERSQGNVQTKAFSANNVDNPDNTSISWMRYSCCCTQPNLADKYLHSSPANCNPIECWWPLDNQN